MYYIQDRRQYVGNCPLFWRQNKNGYTTNLNEAGLFTKEEAESICSNRKTDIAWEQTYIENASTRMVDSQYICESKALFKNIGS